MANVAHANLTGANLHEPKGVATATNKQIYLSNGAGSGSWTTSPVGWGYYRDAYVTGGGVGQTISTTPAIFQVDGAAAKTNETFLPPAIRGVNSLWDTTTNEIISINEGDAYNLRIDMVIDAKLTGTPTVLDIEMDISGTRVYATRTIIFGHFWDLSKTAPYRVSVGVPIFTVAPFPTNKALFWLTVDSGTIRITDQAILLVKTFDGVNF